MRISMIAAVASNLVIGRNNDLPWHLPDDFKWFVQQTKHKPVIMGRGNFESLGCKPLPNRRNIVISRQQPETAGIDVVQTLPDALALAEQDNPCGEIMIIGGQEIYTLALPVADRLYLTLVEANIEGDRCFPDWHGYDWQETEVTYHPVDDKHQYAYRIVILDRIKS